MKLKFEQLKTEITDPTISIDMRSIMDNTIEKLLSVSITLETANTKIYGVRITDIPYTDTWEDADIEGLVMERLKDFEI